MPYTYGFTSNVKYPLTTGGLYLGLDPAKGFPVGIETERHAITIAGAGAGKGAALIIPNLLRWPHNALVIDPKGEAAEHTAEARAAMGQSVHVLAPFADRPLARLHPKLKPFRASFNPLASIRPTAVDARELVNVIADGLVMRHDPKSGFWDSGGLSVIAGLIAFVLENAPPESKNLPSLRKLITCPPDEFANVVTAMSRSSSFGNLPATAASKLTKTGSEAGHFLSVADENTKWLDSAPMAQLLSSSSFDLADLKRQPCTVYLVLPADMLAEHGRFLRLFVRLTLSAMARGGTISGRRCLFMLDEFYSLGHIEEIAKAAGLMRGYGVSLWPFLQDLGQLESLYGRDGAQTFFGNSDAHIFYGNTDGHTLDYISSRLGTVQPHEIMRPPTGDDGYLIRAHQFEMASIGKPRLEAVAVRELIGKGNTDKIARSMIVFAKGSDVLNVQPQPYWKGVFHPIGEGYNPPVLNFIYTFLVTFVAILVANKLIGVLSWPIIIAIIVGSYFFVRYALEKGWDRPISRLILFGKLRKE